MGHLLDFLECPGGSKGVVASVSLVCLAVPVTLADNFKLAEGVRVARHEGRDATAEGVAAKVVSKNWCHQLLDQSVDGTGI